MAFVKDISLRRYDVTLITLDNYFLFTPVLHELAFGQVSNVSYVNLLYLSLFRAAIPIRALLLLWGQKKLNVISGLQ